MTYTTATAMRDLSRVCDLHCSSWQYRILRPLSESRDLTCILMDTSQVLNLLSLSGNSCSSSTFNFKKSFYLSRLNFFINCKNKNKNKNKNKKQKKPQKTKNQTCRYFLTLDEMISSDPGGHSFWFLVEAAEWCQGE